MKSMFHAFATCICLLAIGLTSSFAAESTELGTSSWKGSVVLPGGAELEFSVRFTPNETGLGGVMDIPMQGLRGGELDDVAIEGREMRFTLKPPGAPEMAWAKFETNADEALKTASGVLKQANQEFPVTMQRLAEGESAEKRRPQEPQPPFPYTQRDVKFPGGDPAVMLAGTLTIPERAGPHPAVVLITGSGLQDRDEAIMGHRPFLVLADHLTRAGIAVLRCDDRGVGESTGAAYEPTTHDFAKDAAASVRFLSEQPEIDAAKIGLIGHSEGGMIAPMVAAESDDVRFLVLLAGTGVPGRDVLIAQLEAISRAAGTDQNTLTRQLAAQTKVLDLMTSDADRETLAKAIREESQREIEAMRAADPQNPMLRDEAAMSQQIEAQVEAAMSPWFRTFVTLDPREALRKVRVPVLVMNGEKDLQVLPDQNLPEIEKALADNTDVTIKRLPNLNHLFQASETGSIGEYATNEETFNPEAMAVISEWIRARFVRERQPTP